MKCVILAGGLGTRLSEETSVKPKPLVEIGGKPILWHIMKLYAHHGVKDFIICCGYKGYMIKEYFANYLRQNSDIEVDLKTGEISYINSPTEDWKVTLIDTGSESMTGGRLLRLKSRLEQEDSFCFTYGDGLGDIDVAAAIAYHKKHGKIATITGATPPGRFGAIKTLGEKALNFREKQDADNAIVNAGFFVLSPKVFHYLENDQTVWENEPLEQLALEEQLYVFKHLGFWQPMDTLRDRNTLEAMWRNNEADWRVWED